MNYLLDTHTFIWSFSRSDLIPKRTRRKMQNPANTVFISAVNLWELSIKSRLKKIDLGGVTMDELIGLAKEMEFELISLSPEEAATYCRLEEDSHFDPFDRMLIRQAIRRNLVLISRDTEFEKFVPHGLRLLWE